MFRYELHTMLNKHLYENEKKNDLFLLGKRPLSKVQGVAVKEMIVRLNKPGDEKKNQDVRANEQQKAMQ